MDVRRGDGAVNAYLFSQFYPLLFGIHQQTVIDPFPGLGLNATDRLLQGRLLGKQMPRQAGKCLEGGRVRHMKRQFLITQLPVLLEQRTTQYRLSWQTLAARVIDIFQV